MEKAAALVKERGGLEPLSVGSTFVVQSSMTDEWGFRGNFFQYSRKSYHLSSKGSNILCGVLKLTSGSKQRMGSSTLEKKEKEARSVYHTPTDENGSDGPAVAVYSYFERMLGGVVSFFCWEFIARAALKLHGLGNMPPCSFSLDMQNDEVNLKQSHRGCANTIIGKWHVCCAVFCCYFGVCELAVLVVKNRDECIHENFAVRGKSATVY